MDSRSSTSESIYASSSENNSPRASHGEFSVEHLIAKFKFDEMACVLTPATSFSSFSDISLNLSPVHSHRHKPNKKSKRRQQYVSINDSTPSPPSSPERPASTSISGVPTKLYPNCDPNVWLRSCEAEIIEPISGTVTGVIPPWLKGSLLRNGPGNLKVGDMKFNHLFDSSALLHRFGITNGIVTYQCRFIQTDTYKRNMTANRIVVNEFGTKSVPDPCHSIFKRISSMFKPGEWSDNTLVSIYPFGDEYFTFTECPIIHSINAETLATERMLNVGDYIGVASHSSHPHVMPNGTVYNLGLTVTKTGPNYNIICFPHGEAMFEDSHIVAAIPSRWKFYPSYMHTFGMTEHYFIIVEQPLSLSMPKIMRAQLFSQPLAANFTWFAEQSTCIYLICRQTGKLKYTFEAEAFFYLHIINAYEDDQYVIVDICTYKDHGMLDCMYVEAMENMQSNPNYAELFRGKPMRYVLPLQYYGQMAATVQDGSSLTKSLSISNLFSRLQSSKPKMKRSISEQQNVKYATMDESSLKNNNKGEFNVIDAIEENLVRLENSKAEAYFKSNSGIFCKPELLCDLGCETPRIYYESFMGKKYRYFYAISADVDADNAGTLIKVDVENKTRKTWCETNCYPSEPIFVPNPYCESEDDGVVLAAMIWGNANENRVGLLVLCAKTWTEMGRCEFETPGPVPKCLHGWFAPSKN